MPAPADVRLSGDGCLHLSGRLDRAAVVALWPRLQGLAGQARTLDLGAVSGLDSAGLALVSLLAGQGLSVQGTAPGLEDLAAAYRLPPGLALSPSPVSPAHA